jgi:hypothetical protein
VWLSLARQNVEALAFAAVTCNDRSAEVSRPWPGDDDLPGLVAAAILGFTQDVFPGDKQEADPWSPTSGDDRHVRRQGACDQETG